MNKANKKPGSQSRTTKSNRKRTVQWLSSASVLFSFSAIHSPSSTEAFINSPTRLAAGIRPKNLLSTFNDESEDVEIQDASFGNRRSTNDRELTSEAKIPSYKGFLFEQEANDYTNNCLSNNMIKDEHYNLVTVTKLKSIQVYPKKNNDLQLDTFGYIIAPPVDFLDLNNKGSFIRPVVDILAFRDPLTSISNLLNELSPRARKAFQLCLSEIDLDSRQNAKYVLGEARYGSACWDPNEWKENPATKKVLQLECKIKQMMNRMNDMLEKEGGAHDELKNVSINDVTQIVGLSFLHFSQPKTLKFKEAKKQISWAVGNALSKDKTPLLWRLAESKLLVISVISSEAAPASSVFEDLYSRISNLKAERDRENASSYVDTCAKALQNIKKTRELLKESETDEERGKFNNFLAFQMDFVNNLKNPS